MLSEKHAEVLGNATAEQFAEIGEPESIRNFRERCVRALKKDFDSEVAWDLAFHMADWIEDAAQLVAIVMCPKKFTKSEIRDALDGLTIHAVNHVVAATHLDGNRIQDVFKLGIAVEDVD